MSATPAAAAAPPAAAPLSNHESFLLILNDPAGRLALLDFLKSGYSEHHLIFWEEVETKYKLIKDQSERDTTAKEYYHLYIKNGSKQQINIHEPQRLKLQAAIEKLEKKPSPPPDAASKPDLFDEASAHCLELIKGNYFFPFQQSKQYATYQQEKKVRDAQAEADAEAKKKKENSKSCTIL